MRRRVVRMIKSAVLSLREDLLSRIYANTREGLSRNEIDRLQNRIVQNNRPAVVGINAFSYPDAFQVGNAGRNILTGPGRVNFDYSVFKNFALTEKFKLQFRTEIFNLFNHAQFDLPNTAIGNPNAGIITGIVGTPWQIQFALRLSF